MNHWLFLGVGVGWVSRYFCSAVQFSKNGMTRKWGSRVTSWLWIFVHLSVIFIRSFILTCNALFRFIAWLNCIHQNFLNCPVFLTQNRSWLELLNHQLGVQIWIIYVLVSRTKIIEVDPSETGIVSGSLFTQGFPGSAYFPSPDGLQIWMFVNRRPNTTLRLKFNDIFLQPPQLVGFCNNDFINVSYHLKLNNNSVFASIVSGPSLMGIFFYTPSCTCSFVL